MTALDIETLTPAERIDLMGRLWDSLDHADLPVSPAQRMVLEQRLRTADADLATSVAWESVRAELAARRA